MRSYRDYLDERKVPRGPWVIMELHNEKPKEEKVVQLRKRKES